MNTATSTFSEFCEVLQKNHCEEHQWLFDRSIWNLCPLSSTALAFTYFLFLVWLSCILTYCDHRFFLKLQQIIGSFRVVALVVSETHTNHLSHCNGVGRCVSRIPANIWDGAFCNSNATALHLRCLREFWIFLWWVW